jgi:hypothetical protein
MADILTGVVIKFNYQKPNRRGIANVQGVGEVDLSASHARRSLNSDKGPEYYSFGEEPVLPMVGGKILVILSRSLDKDGKDKSKPFASHWSTVHPCVSRKKPRR